MTIKNKFKNAKDFLDFIGNNQADFHQMYVKEIYNMGDAEYDDSPLFLYSGYSVIMAYLSDEGFRLNIYDKDFFIRNIRAGIFREAPDSEKSYCFNFLKSKLINSFVQDIHFQENDDGTICSIDLAFKNGQHLHIEHSAIVKGTMCSYIE